jgi:hypothetical protein
MFSIPKYKRDSFTFISNLSDYTANVDYPDTYKRDGYLLSEHYTNKNTLQLAKEVRRRRNLLISDNGNYSRMKAVAKVFDAEGLTLLQQAKVAQKKYGHLPQSLVDSRLKLIQEIAKSCQEQLIKTDYKAVLETQLKINPHYLIGMENLTIPVLMLCHLMHPVFNPQPQEIATYQHQTLDFFKAQCDGKFGFKKELNKTAKFLVLHANDYASALQASQKSLHLPKDGIAISYGGAMHSRRWINSINLGKGTIQFGEKLPESYLIAQSITLGMLNGHPTDIPYHILGVGTPILMPLIGYQLRNSKAVSIDSTAPFRDAFVGKLYGKKHGFIKMDMFKLVAYCLVNDQPFKDSSPFYKSFVSKYPNNWKGLQTKLNIKPSTSTKILALELKERGDLMRAYLPFFTPITSELNKAEKEFTQDLRIARSGYNYWVIQYICKKVRQKKVDEEAFRKWVELEIDKYTKIASNKWAKAVEKTYILMEKYRN